MAQQHLLRAYRLHHIAGGQFKAACEHPGTPLRLGQHLRLRAQVQAPDELQVERGWRRHRYSQWRSHRLCRSPRSQGQGWHRYDWHRRW